MAFPPSVNPSEKVYDHLNSFTMFSTEGLICHSSSWRLNVHTHFNLSKNMAFCLAYKGKLQEVQKEQASDIRGLPSFLCS